MFVIPKVREWVWNFFPPCSLIDPGLAAHPHPLAPKPPNSSLLPSRLCADLSRCDGLRLLHPLPGANWNPILPLSPVSLVSHNHASKSGNMQEAPTVVLEPFPLRDRLLIADTRSGEPTFGQASLPGGQFGGIWVEI